MCVNTLHRFHTNLKAMSFEIGDQVGDYRIVGTVGAGGAACVFKVEHEITGRVEAMKVLLRGQAESSRVAERFLREIKLQAQLEHPHIAAVHNALWACDELVMVMELIEGYSLDKLLADGPLRPGQGLRYGVQALTALEHAHSRGVTHRDIKPENIMVTTDGTLKLMDFGLAKIDGESGLTQPGAVLGSLFYISPEQARGQQDVDHRSDIYSVGAVLYEATTGRRPFPYLNTYRLLQAAIEEEPRPPIDLEPSIPQSMNDVILKAMAKDRDERFKDSAEFRKTLEAISRNPTAVKVDLGARAAAQVETLSKTGVFRKALIALGAALGMSGGEDRNRTETGVSSESKR